jgi:hypothetical protein
VLFNHFQTRVSQFVLIPEPEEDSDRANDDVDEVEGGSDARVGIGNGEENAGNQGEDGTYNHDNQEDDPGGIPLVEIREYHPQNHHRKHPEPEKSRRNAQAKSAFYENTVLFLFFFFFFCYPAAEMPG